MAEHGLQVERVGQICIVRLGPRYDNLDEVTLSEVQDCLLSCADDPQTHDMVLDLANTEFFGTSFLEVLFRAWNRIRQKGGRFALCGLQQHPEEVVRIARLDQIWTLCDSVERALQSMDSAPTAGGTS